MVIKLIAVPPFRIEQVRHVCPFLTSRCGSFFNFYFSNPIKSDQPVGGVCHGRLLSGDPLHAALPSFHVLHWLFFAAPESSNASFVSGLSVRWRLFSSALSSCLRCHCVADKSSSIEASASPAPFKGKTRGFTGTDWKPGSLSGGQSCAHARVTAIGGNKERLFFWNYKI